MAMEDCLDVGNDTEHLRVSVSLIDAALEGATERLKGAGLEIEGCYGDVVTGSIQASQLPRLAGLSEVKGVDAASIAIRH